MIIKKKVRVTKEIEEHVLVNKRNASKILKQISKDDPYCKFVKALSEGKTVLCNGFNHEDFVFDEPTSSYTIEEQFNRKEWKCVLVKQNDYSNYVLHRYNINFPILYPENSFDIKFVDVASCFTNEEFKSLPIEK